MVRSCSMTQAFSRGAERQPAKWATKFAKRSLHVVLSLTRKNATGQLHMMWELLTCQGTIGLLASSLTLHMLPADIQHDQAA